MSEREVTTESQSRRGFVWRKEDSRGAGIPPDPSMSKRPDGSAAGYKDATQIKKDPELDALRDREELQKLISELEKN